MINIIRHGNKVYKITCAGCGCIFEFTDEDISTVEGANGDYVQVRCPDCNKPINAWYKEEWLKK